MAVWNGVTMVFAFQAFAYFLAHRAGFIRGGCRSIIQDEALIEHCVSASKCRSVMIDGLPFLEAASGQRTSCVPS
jgi:hypothetical protein